VLVTGVQTCALPISDTLRRQVFLESFYAIHMLREKFLAQVTTPTLPDLPPAVPVPQVPVPTFDANLGAKLAFLDCAPPKKFDAGDMDLTQYFEGAAAHIRAAYSLSNPLKYRFEQMKETPETILRDMQVVHDSIKAQFKIPKKSQVSKRVRLPATMDHSGDFKRAFDAQRKEMEAFYLRSFEYRDRQDAYIRCLEQRLAATKDINERVNALHSVIPAEWVAKYASRHAENVRRNRLGSGRPLSSTFDDATDETSSEDEVIVRRPAASVNRDRNIFTISSDSDTASDHFPNSGSDATVD